MFNLYLFFSFLGSIINIGGIVEEGGGAGLWRAYIII